MADELEHPLAWIMVSTDYGTIIVNRMDYCPVSEDRAHGVGVTILQTAEFAPTEARLYQQVLQCRRLHCGDGVVAVDCGANIGLHTIQMARALRGWGSVLAIEAQERVYYALAGNIVLGNHVNARAVHAAMGLRPGTMRIPTPNYERPGSYGSLELRRSPHAEYIGQPIDYDASVEVPVISLDSLQLPRVDLLKIDVERMEWEVITGGSATIARCRPVISVEYTKAGVDPLTAQLKLLGYERFFELEDMLIAVHRDDPVAGHLVVDQ